METLNLIANGNIFKLSYDVIKGFFTNYSRSANNKNKGCKGIVLQSSKATTMGQKNMTLEI
jgi:hypothetical protein